MAQIKYDVSDVETGGGGEQPDPGLYRGKIAAITHRSVKKDKTKISDLEVVLDVGEEYARLWYYAKLPDDPAWDKEKHGWKFRELTDALALPPKGGIDTAKLKKHVGQEVNVKVVADTDENGDYRGKAKNIFLPTEGTKKDKAEPDASAAGGDEGPYGREEIETWTDEDLKGYAEELGVEVPTGRGAKAKLIDALVEAEEGDEPEPEPDAEGTSAALEGVDEEFLNELKADPEEYADWTDEDLQWLIEGLGIGGNVPTSGRGWKAKAIAAFVELAQGADGGDGEGDNYDDEEEWPLIKLKEEVATRNEADAGIEIAGRATREKLIAALRADDGNAKDPF